VSQKGVGGSVLEPETIVLDVKDLHTQFHTRNGIVHAVNGNSFSLGKGKTLGIVGESGCGKSVTMLSIMRLLPEETASIPKGEVYFMGQDLLKLSKSEMQKLRGSKIAMIFQDPGTSLNPVLTIGLQLIEPMMIHLGMNRREAYHRAEELLHLVGIPDAHARLKEYPHQFSGGMQQRVMIAMSLACNPLLLIADEPTTALDVTIQAQIVELIKSLRDKFEMSLVWITHDLGLVAGLADRILVMYAGYIVEEASVFELYANPKHPYTNALLSALPRIDSGSDEKLREIKGMPPDLIGDFTGCPFRERCLYAEEKCDLEVPVLRELSEGHKIACWKDI
jgi:oligopeptide/dipeptide ABC transporter ATP-binding protein